MARSLPAIMAASILAPLSTTAGAQQHPTGFADIVLTAEIIVAVEAIDQRAEWVTIGTSPAIVTRVTFRGG